jgi:hypothetical protein
MICHQDTLIMKQVALNRSSLILKIILENAETLQLYKDNKNRNYLQKLLDFQAWRLGL